MSRRKSGWLASAIHGDVERGSGILNNPHKILPRIGKRYLEIVEHLEEGLRGDPERARAALTDAIGSRITLEPDESGRFLWAEFGLETTPQLVAVGLPEFMVAGVGFEPTTFGL